jgi:hypothetical protein
MYMNKTALVGFEHILSETLELQGWTMPNPVVQYTVQVLAEKIDKNPWEPTPSFAQRYMTIRNAADAQDLADTCFFTRAVFPEFGSQRGINSSYYVDMGQGCYHYVYTVNANPAIKQMRDHFEFIAEIVWTAVRAHGHFRPLWD